MLFFGASFFNVRVLLPVASNFRFLDRVVSRAMRLSDVKLIARTIYKARFKPYCVLETALPEVHANEKNAHVVVFVHSRYLDVPRSSAVQFSRKFVPAWAQNLNTLD